MTRWLGVDQVKISFSSIVKRLHLTKPLNPHFALFAMLVDTSYALMYRRTNFHGHSDATAFFNDETRLPLRSCYPRSGRLDDFGAAQLGRVGDHSFEFCHVFDELSFAEGRHPTQGLRPIGF